MGWVGWGVARVVRGALRSAVCEGGVGVWVTSGGLVAGRLMLRVWFGATASAAGSVV